MINKLRNITGRLKLAPDDLDTQDFRRLCRRKWPSSRLAGRSSVVLVGQSPWRPSICAYAYLSNHIADATVSDIEACFFGRHEDRESDRTYQAFGAKLTLNWRYAARFRAQAMKLGTELCSAFRNKADVFSICIAGVPIGDLIYDTYLRYYLQATVDLLDDRFRDLVVRGVQIALACGAYFDRHKVAGYIAYDAPYIESGIVHRFAARDGVPIYLVTYTPFAVYLMDNMIRGDARDFRNWPSKVAMCLHDRSKFASLPSREQEEARGRAREQLLSRLAGDSDFRVLPTGDSAFGAPSEEAVLKPGNRPRILVLLHDFCDAPNVLRWSLFEDFWEWLHFLLPRAAKTGFDWYVKPHPHRHFDRKKAEANQKIVESFRSAYPAVSFLQSSVSNRQLIQEGISSMFTVHGTAGHEFAYLGIPVVNAGFNPHINYNFNLHARSREEYENLINRAGSLQVPIDKAEVEEFFYSHFLDESPRSEVDLIPEHWRGQPNQTALESGPEIYRHFVAADCSARDAIVRSYLDSFLKNNHPNNIKTLPIRKL